MSLPGKLAPHKIKFAQSNSPDVVTYKFYYEEAPADVQYKSAFVDLGNNVVDNFVEVDLAVRLGTYQLDSIYNIGVVAVDDMGNESAMSKANNYPLDFVAPEAPGTIIKL